eukprot:10081033-Alexandrium_andersonii.AAC.1
MQRGHRRTSRTRTVARVWAPPAPRLRRGHSGACGRPVQGSPVPSPRRLAQKRAPNSWRDA